MQFGKVLNVGGRQIVAVQSGAVGFHMSRRDFSDLARGSCIHPLPDGRIAVECFPTGSLMVTVTTGELGALIARACALR